MRGRPSLVAVAVVVAAAAACGRPAGPPAAPGGWTEPPRDVRIDDLDVVFDGDAIPLLFTAVRRASARIAGAPPAFSPRVAAAWETAVAEARARGVDVALSPSVAGGGLALLVVDTAAIAVVCDLERGGRGVALAVRGAEAAEVFDAPPPWRARGEGVEIAADWPEGLGARAEAAAVGTGLDPAAVLGASIREGARVLVPPGAKALGADVREGPGASPDEPGLSGALVLAGEEAYVGTGGLVVRVTDPALLEALRAWFDDVLWPAGAVPAADLLE